MFSHIAGRFYNKSIRERIRQFNKKSKDYYKCDLNTACPTYQRQLPTPLTDKLLLQKCCHWENIEFNTHHHKIPFKSTDESPLSLKQEKNSFITISTSITGGQVNWYMATIEPIMHFNYLASLANRRWWKCLILNNSYLLNNIFVHWSRVCFFHKPLWQQAWHHLESKNKSTHVRLFFFSTWQTMTVWIAIITNLSPRRDHYGLGFPPVSSPGFNKSSVLSVSKLIVVSCLVFLTLAIVLFCKITKTQAVLKTVITSSQKAIYWSAKTSGWANTKLLKKISHPWKSVPTPYFA